MNTTDTRVLNQPSLALRLWQGTCVRYTVIALCMLTINLILAEDEGAYVEPLRFLLFLPCAFFLTVSTLVRKADKLSTGARVVLHPLCTLGGIYLCLYLPYQLKVKPTGRQFWAVFAIALVLYGIVMGILLFCTRKKKQKEIDAAPYERVFGSNRK